MIPQQSAPSARRAFRVGVVAEAIAAEAFSSFVGPHPKTPTDAHYRAANRAVTALEVLDDREAEDVEVTDPDVERRALAVEVALSIFGEDAAFDTVLRAAYFISEGLLTA